MPKKIDHLRENHSLQYYYQRGYFSIYETGHKKFSKFGQRSFSKTVLAFHLQHSTDEIFLAFLSPPVRRIFITEVTQTCKNFSVVRAATQINSVFAESFVRHELFIDNVTRQHCVTKASWRENDDKGFLHRDANSECFALYE